MRSLILAVLVLAACGGPTQPTQQQVASLVVLQGDQQVDTVARTLPVAIAVQAKDAVGGPAAGVVLNWYTITNDGLNCVGCSDTVFVGAGLTNGTGGAKLQWTLGTRAGPQGLIAWAIGSAGERVVHVHATAVAVHDRAIGIVASQATTTPGGFILISNFAYTTDQYWNNAGTPLVVQAPAGWRIVGDTAYAPEQVGTYILPLALDQARGDLSVRVQ